MKRINSIRKRISLVLLALLTAVGAAAYIYLNSNYQPDEVAVAAMKGSSDVYVYEPAENLVVFAPDAPRVGFVFYPGGKVDHKAYAPLLCALAREGILCVLPKMPFDLAVLDVNAAEEAREAEPEINEWYIGGHSLGGAMAASYVSEHPEDYKGLILLASYSTDNLKNNGLKVISLYGSNDKILNMEKYAQNRNNLPDDTIEVVLDGGNHAQFGNYGLQEGDGEAAVSAETQIVWTVKMISDEMHNR